MPSDNTSTLITVKNLTRRYGEFHAVNNISFELARGDILGFLGPNGAGKSSTMQMVTGNLAPTEGEILINGTDLLENPKAAKTSIGYLPENPPLYKEMTVLEYLHFCAHLHHIKKAQISDACNKTIARCGLTNVQHRLINNLSKGYQQRVGIAQAILHSPPVIILDEPTDGLDPIQILEIRNLIKTLGESHGIILCTHILPEVQAVCNRVQIINQGNIVYSEDMSNLFEKQDNRYDVTLATKVSTENLVEHVAFKLIEKTDDYRLIIESDLPADKLCEYIVEKNWGLTRFTTKEITLEQKFIELTTSDTDIVNKNFTSNSIQ